MTKAPSKVLVLGAGGVGAWVAKSLKSRGHDVLATTTQVDTDRALTCLGVEVLSWRWSPGASWADLEAFGASHWVVTVPPRGGKEHVHAFHEALNASAQRAGVSLLVWTSSTAVYDPNQTGSIGEGDAGRHLSRHTGLSMLDIEDIHRHSTVPFVALRFGGLFSSARHPAWALSKRTPVQQADANGTVTFEGKPFEEGGKYAVVVPGPKFFEFLMVNEPMEFKTSASNPSGDIEVVKSKENEVFYGYLNFIKEKRAARAPFDEVLRDSSATDAQVNDAKAGIQKLTDEVNEYQYYLTNDPRDFLFGKYLSRPRTWKTQPCGNTCGTGITSGIAWTSATLAWCETGRLTN